MTFDAFLVQPQGIPAKGRGVAFMASLAVHGAVLIGALVFSFWHIDEITPPALAVTFRSLPAPAPPPPRGSSRATTRATVRPRTRTVVQPTPIAIAPKEQPAKEREHVDDGDANGDKVGEKNGARDGVIGGTGRDIGIGPPIGTPADVFVTPHVAKGQLAIDPQSDQYRPKLPPAVIRSGMVIWVMAKLCASSDGQVQQVKIIKGADPTLDPIIAAALRTWRYRPWAVDGRPVPFCTTVRYEVVTR